jgi:hypothetical protein
MFGLINNGEGFMDDVVSITGTKVLGDVAVGGGVGVGIQRAFQEHGLVVMVVLLGLEPHP